MGINYGRGFGRKASFTKKCSCENPKWSGSHIEVNARTGEITYVVNCASCKAYWASKSRSSRELWDMDTLSHKSSLNGYGSRSDDVKKTNREWFRELDEKRLAYLEMVAENRAEAAAEAAKEAEKAKRAAEKFREEMEG